MSTTQPVTVHENPRRALRQRIKADRAFARRYHAAAVARIAAATVKGA